MQILLIRHGQSEADILDVHEGRADFPLTELGREQARKMAAWVKEMYKPERILASTLKRAHEVAEILQKEVGCELELWPELMEMNNGERAGLPMEEGFRLYPHPEHHHVKLAGGESMLEFRLRIEAVVSRLMSEMKPGQRVAVVAHGGTISKMIQSFLGMPAKSDTYFHTDDTGVHLFEWNEHGPKVAFLNSTVHLAGKGEA